MKMTSQSCRKSTKRALAIAFAFILFSMIGGWLYLRFPPRPKPVWDTSSDTRIITVGYGGEVDYNYIHDVQVWGDGHIIWVERELDGRRRVLEGYISKEELSQLVDQLVGAGFFEGYRRFEWDIVSGRYLDVNLSNAHRQVGIDPISGYDNRSVLDMVDFLRSGAGTEGEEFLPEEGSLLAYPLEQTSWSGNAEADYQWPDSEFGYGLESVYNNRPHNEIRIEGKELEFAWEIVNSPAPLVESKGKVYWIAVRIPKVSL